MPPGRNWPKRIHGLLSRRHRVEVLFGPPIWPGADEHRNDVMIRVRAHLEAVGLPTRVKQVTGGVPGVSGRGLAIARLMSAKFQ